MEARRRRWIAALMVFVLWVAGLAAMAVFSGRRPPRHRPAQVGIVKPETGVR